MANSMTGFGRGEKVDSERRVVIEIKTVNNKYCDMQIRMPRVLASLENKIREKISNYVQRGKVDVFITYEDNSPQSSQVICDLVLARAYTEALQKISRTVDIPEGINASVISRFSDVLRTETASVDNDLAWRVLEPALQQALENLCHMRRLEGEKLLQTVAAQIDEMEQLQAKIARRAPLVPEDYRQRLKQRIKELLGDQAAKIVDEQRLAAEVALYADKCSVDEELVRLQSHLAQLRSIMKKSGPVGKKMDFLIQEINREINTIGSKANDLEMTNHVVAMKSNQEKIREQIQNLE